MARRVTFIHTADFHFGAPMRGFGNLSAEWSQKLMRAIAASFENVVQTALARKVDFVVIAGDMFDSARASYGDYLAFFEGIERLTQAEIPVYLVAGNHDPYTVWRRDVPMLPEGALLMGSEACEFALYERDGEPLCIIGARGYYSQAWRAGEPISRGITRSAAVRALRGKKPRAVEAPFSVGVIHTGLEADQSKAFSDPAELLDSDIDYWACGHVHARRVLPNEFTPRIVFPGCIQARDAKEAGACGCYVVTMEERPGAWDPRILLEFVPTSSVVFEQLELDVGDCRTLADIKHLIISHLFRKSGEVRCEDLVAHITLAGETDLHRYLAQSDVRESLRKRISDSYPSFYCDAIVDRTQAVRNRAALEQEGVFAAQVLRVADEQAAHPDEMVNFVQSEFVKRGVSIPSSLVRCIGDFEKEAETLVMDLLEREEADLSEGDVL